MPQVKYSEKMIWIGDDEICKLIVYFFSWCQFYIEHIQSDRKCCPSSLESDFKCFFFVDTLSICIRLIIWEYILYSDTSSGYIF